MEITPAPPTAWARLGYILNWAGIAAGIGVGGFLAIALSPMGRGWQLIVGVAGFLCCYAVGRGARYILASR
jgi:hypothetical protein